MAQGALPTLSDEPPMGTILHGIEIPPHGGDTLFANQYLACEALSDGMKRMLAGLRAVLCHPAIGRGACIPWCEPTRKPVARCCS